MRINLGKINRVNNHKSYYTSIWQASVSSPMEVICTDSHLILQPLQKGENNVWVSRSTGRFEVRPAWDLAGQDNPECLGIVWGLVGKLKVHQGTGSSVKFVLYESGFWSCFINFDYINQ